MPPVTVLVLAPLLAADAGPLERRLDDARTALAEHHRHAFLAAGADEVVVRREPPDDTPFGARLRRLVEELGPAGLVVLGAGSIPLATAADLRAFVAAAAADEPGALANHRYSADIIAIARAAAALRDLPPDLASDNALPRWLAEVAGIPVRDLRATAPPRHGRGLAAGPPPARGLARRSEACRSPMTPMRAWSGIVSPPCDASLPIPGPSCWSRVARPPRTCAGWSGRPAPGRGRFVEERGLRTAGIGATVGRPNRRPPRSLLGELLDRDGPGSLGRHVAALCDGALLDSRVLLAHRRGGDERGWPPAEDRFASDLLLPDRVRDPWLAELTAAAVEAPIPVLLGGHGLVGPGLRLALGVRARGQG